MVGCLGQSRPARDADVVARAVVATALAALAVIHTVDLPNTLGPTPLVGVGYFGIIALAMLAGAVMIVRSHWLAWAAAGGLAVAAMGGYVLTRFLPGGFLDDHGDVGNWRCPFGYRRARRGDADHPAGGGLVGLAGPGPRREHSSQARCAAGNSREGRQPG